MARGKSDLLERAHYAQILLVDDEPDNLTVLESLLRHSGFRSVVSTNDSRDVVDLFTEIAPDLVVLDLHMPHKDGFDVMTDLRPLIPESTYLPILVLTGDPDPDVRRRALAMGAKDFLTKPFESMEVLLRIKNLLETRTLHQELRRHAETLEEKVRDRTRELAEAQVEILRRLAIAAEYRDDITGEHAERVGVLAALLAQVIGLHRDEVQIIRRAATLHDVGKIGVPDAILMKPGPLTEDEFSVMKTHTAIGGRILSGSQYPLLQVAREIAITHHEHWSGGGYTAGLIGTDIPLVGRLVAVADVFDSLTHRRPYKEAYAVETAVEIVRQKSGGHFDPKVVRAFNQLAENGVLGELDLMERALQLGPPLTASEVERVDLTAMAGGSTRVRSGAAGS